ncbi:MAG: FtsW/RodA/SpoVE family cell cycle protein [Bacteroidales bacterium]|jgi:cell division protein FtsW|nr:FtsW/RodA/SpoVE family cell cycle protein [Bacteroidales bacterium]
MKNFLGKLQIKGDKIIWIVYFALSIFSLIFVFTSIGKNVYRLDGNILTTFFKQLFIIAVGIVAIFIVHNIKYVRYAKFLKILYAFSVGLLLFTLIAGKIFGKVANRWIEIPGIGQFQPSEFVKYILIMYVASELASLKDRIKEKNEFWKLMGKIFLICLLIFPENFSTAALIFLSCFFLVFIAGAQWKHILKVLVLGIGAVVVVFGLNYVGIEIGRVDTWINRFAEFYNRDSNEYNQANSAIMAIATGGVTGLGIGNTVEGRFLSESHNDFIFAVILEEGGFLMCFLILLAYFVLFYRCIEVSRKANGAFGQYLALGISFTIIIQALVNMLVAIGAIPVTGQTLPFLSYGGTSFLITSCALGIVLNISAETQKAKQKKLMENEEENSQIEVENINIEEV